MILSTGWYPNSTLPRTSISTSMSISCLLFEFDMRRDIQQLAQVLIKHSKVTPIAKLGDLYETGAGVSTSGDVNEPRFSLGTVVFEVASRSRDNLELLD